MRVSAAQARASLLLAGLRTGLAGGPDLLDVHYMPSVTIASGRCSGFEALVRLQHPELGAVSPALFVPLAEEHGLASALGDWVRAHVLDDVRSGRLGDVPVAVNVSAVELAGADFADRLLDGLERAGVPAERFSVEVTETAVAAHFAEAVEALQRLRAAGVSVALDDFGTGHASLDYLARLPCDTVKVDRSFVSGMTGDLRSAAIVAGVVGMARSTGHRVIAEGVETSAQLAALAALDCDEVQGYLMGRPVPAEAVSTPRMSAWPEGTARRHPAVPIVPGARAPASRTDVSAQTVVDLSRDLGDAPDVAAAFGVLVAALRPLVDFTGGSVQMLGPDGVRLVAAHPPPSVEALAARLPAGRGVGGAVIATGQVRYLPDITVPEAAVAADRRARSTTRHTRSYVAVPLMQGSRCLGLVQLDSVEPDAFGEDVQLLLAACAAPLTAAVARLSPD